MDINFDHLLTSISAYITKNRLMHSTVNEFIQRGRFHQLAKILHKDECNLPLIVLYKYSKEKATLLQIISTIKKELFNIDQDYPDGYQLWNHTYKNKNFMNNQAFVLK